MFAGMAFGAGAVLTAAALFDAQPVGVLGQLGGFLAPLLMATVDPSPISLFSYLFVLDGAALALATFRKWRTMELTSGVATLVFWSGWLTDHYSPEALTEVLVLGTLFFLLFALMGVWNHLIQNRPVAAGDLVLVSATPFFYGFFLVTLTNPLYAEWHGSMALGLALFYFVLGLIAGAVRPGQRLLWEFLWGIGFACAAAAAPLYFTRYWILVAWSAYVVVLTVMGFRHKQPKLRAGTLVLQALLLLIALVVFLESLVDLRPAAPLFGQAAPGVYGWSAVLNARSLGLASVMLSLGVVSWLYRRYAAEVQRWESQVAGVWTLFGVATAVLLCIGETKIAVFVTGQPMETALSLLLFYLAAAVGVLLVAAATVGPRWLFDAARLGAAAVAFIFVLCVLQSNDARSLAGRPLWFADAFFNPRGLAFASMIAVLAVAALWLPRRPDLVSEAERESGSYWPPATQSALLAWVVGWLMVATETNAYAHANHWSDVALTVLWTLLTAAASVVVLSLGFRHKQPTIRYGGLLLQGLLLLMTLGVLETYTSEQLLPPVFGSAAPGVYGWGNVLNVRTIGLAAVAGSLAVVSWMYRRYAAEVKPWESAAAGCWTLFAVV
ncbi:MAG: DUF2339 domain-containing protein, partial [Planctomycetia bacterium]